MATQYVDFQPTVNTLFQFPAVFDGGQYQVIVPWGLFGQRYYLSCNAADGSNVFYKGLVGSPSRQGTPFTTNALNSIATVDNPTGIGIGTVVVSNNVPPGTIVTFIAGTVLALSQAAIATGTDAAALFSNDINLLGGYFVTSTLVFRAATAQFEIGTYPPLPVTSATQAASPTFVPAAPPPAVILPVTSPFPPSGPPVKVPNPFILDYSKLGTSRSVGGDVLV